MGVLMNNKSATYRVEYLCGGCNKAHAWGECTKEQPLNTHPAKTLTDEEIISCIDESEPDTTDMIRFARAILRKAQE
jgi:hypothetical protein